VGDERDQRHPLRILLAVGNAEQERRLRDALSGDGLSVAGRCLDGPSLVERAAALDVDVGLVSGDLHRLSAATLTAVREARLPVVLLAEAGDLERFGGLAHLAPAGAAAEEIASALREAYSRGPAYAAKTPGTDPGPQPPGAAGVRDGDESGGGEVLAVVSGKGAPGKTTLAIALAATLGREGHRVALVDADLRGGNVSAYLDLDPRRGLLGLIYGGNGASLEGSIEDELQEGPGFAVLSGIERAEARSKVSAEMVTAMVAALRSRLEYVIVDAGQAIAGMPEPATDALLRCADRVLVVSGADLVAVWNSRAALKHLREHLGLTSDEIAIIVNRREGREHYAGEEVERALGAPVLAVVPEDRRAARRAIARQLPMTAVGGRAAREVRALGRQLVAGTTAVTLPRRRRRLSFGLRRAAARRF